MELQNSSPPIGSLAHLETIASLDPCLYRHFKRSTAIKSYRAFTECLYEDLDDACQMLQERCDQYFDKNEDVITATLVISLRSMGYNASHDTKVGGHVDVVIRGKDPRHLWIGEAKRDTSIGWVHSGFDQLCNRYATGDSGQDHGALLIYCQKGNAADFLSKWHARLNGLGLDEFSSFPCVLRPNLAFSSAHLLNSSGTKFNVRHVAINLKYK